MGPFGGGGGDMVRIGSGLGARPRTRFPLSPLHFMPRSPSPTPALRSNGRGGDGAARAQHSPFSSPTKTSSSLARTPSLPNSGFQSPLRFFGTPFGAFGTPQRHQSPDARARTPQRAEQQMVTPQRTPGGHQKEERGPAEGVKGWPAGLFECDGTNFPPHVPPGYVSPFVNKKTTAAAAAHDSSSRRSPATRAGSPHSALGDEREERGGGVRLVLRELRFGDIAHAPAASASGETSASGRDQADWAPDEADEEGSVHRAPAMAEKAPWRGAGAGRASERAGAGRSRRDRSPQRSTSTTSASDVSRQSPLRKRQCSDASVNGPLRREGNAEELHDPAGPAQVHATPALHRASEELEQRAEAEGSAGEEEADAGAPFWMKPWSKGSLGLVGPAGSFHEAVAGSPAAALDSSGAWAAAPSVTHLASPQMTVSPVPVGSMQAQSLGLLRSRSGSRHRMQEQEEDDRNRQVEPHIEFPEDNDFPNVSLVIDEVRAHSRQGLGASGVLVDEGTQSGNSISADDQPHSSREPAKGHRNTGWAVTSTQAVALESGSLVIMEAPDWDDEASADPMGSAPGGRGGAPGYAVEHLDSEGVGDSQESLRVLAVGRDGRASMQGLWQSWEQGEGEDARQGHWEQGTGEDAGQGHLAAADAASSAGESEESVVSEESEDSEAEEELEQEHAGTSVLGEPLLPSAWAMSSSKADEEAEAEAEDSMQGLVYGIPALNQSLPPLEGLDLPLSPSAPPVLSHGSLVCMYLPDGRHLAAQHSSRGRWKLGATSAGLGPMQAYDSKPGALQSCLGAMPAECVFVLCYLGARRIGLRSVAAEGRCLSSKPGDQSLRLGSHFDTWAFEELATWQVLAADGEGGWSNEADGVLEGPLRLENVGFPQCTLQVFILGLLAKPRVAWKSIEENAARAPHLWFQVQQLRQQVHEAAARAAPAAQPAEPALEHPSVSLESAAATMAGAGAPGASPRASVAQATPDSAQAKAEVSASWSSQLAYLAGAGADALSSIHIGKEPLAPATQEIQSSWVSTGRQDSDKKPGRSSPAQPVRTTHGTRPRSVSAPKERPPLSPFSAQASEMSPGASMDTLASGAMRWGRVADDEVDSFVRERNLSSGGHLFLAPPPNVSALLASYTGLPMARAGTGRENKRTGGGLAWKAQMKSFDFAEDDGGEQAEGGSRLTQSGHASPALGSLHVLRRSISMPRPAPPAAKQAEQDRALATPPARQKPAEEQIQEHAIVTPAATMPAPAHGPGAPAVVEEKGSELKQRVAALRQRVSALKDLEMQRKASAGIPARSAVEASAVVLRESHRPLPTEAADAASDALNLQLNSTSAQSQGRLQADGAVEPGTADAQAEPHTREQRPGTAFLELGQQHVPVLDPPARAPPPLPNRAMPPPQQPAVQRELVNAMAAPKMRADAAAAGARKGLQQVQHRTAGNMGAYRKGVEVYEDQMHAQAPVKPAAHKPSVVGRPSLKSGGAQGLGRRPASTGRGAKQGVTFAEPLHHGSNAENVAPGAKGLGHGPRYAAPLRRNGGPLRPTSAKQPTSSVRRLLRV